MKDHLLTTLENSANYTLGVAGAMPEQHYAFRPVKEVWSFGELMNHIAYGIVWWEDNYIKGEKKEWDPPAAPAHKKDIIAALEKAYDGLRNTIRGSKLGQEAIDGFHATLDHITHHRGQGVLYLRCNGLTPPEYLY